GPERPQRRRSGSSARATGDGRRRRARDRRTCPDRAPAETLSCPHRRRVWIARVLIVVFALGIRSYTTRDGMVLGATVGFGFAALESSGYALASLFVVHGNQLFLSLPSVVVNELVRGVLAPFGHGLWSAILGGVIFHAARNGRLRPTLAILITYIGVSVLHAPFDSFGGIVGYIVISVIGIVPLVFLWLRVGGRKGTVSS